MTKYRIISGVFLSVLYSLIISAAFFTFTNSGLNYNPSSSTKEVLEDISKKIVSTSSQSERTINTHSNSVTSVSKVQFKSYWAIINIGVRLIESTRNQYIHFSGNFILKLHTVDRLFPFHYFL